jgi:hypothetical protein
MKTLSVVTLFLALFSSILVAAPLSVEQQDSRMQEIAKGIRRQYYIQRYEDVSTHIVRMNKESLEHHITDGDDRRYESTLNEGEIAELKSCLASEEKCSLYLVWVSSSYMSGYGEDAHFVMLDTMTGRFEELSHTVYAE